MIIIAIAIAIVVVVVGGGGGQQREGLGLLLLLAASACSVVADVLYIRMDVYGTKLLAQAEHMEHWRANAAECVFQLRYLAKLAKQSSFLFLFLFLFFLAPHTHRTVIASRTVVEYSRFASFFFFGLVLRRRAPSPSLLPSCF